MKPGAVRGGASTTMGCREWLGTRLQWNSGCGMRDVMESEIVEKGGRDRDRGMVEEGSTVEGEGGKGQGRRKKGGIGNSEGGTGENS